MKISVCTDAVFAGRTAEGIAATAALELPAIEFWGWGEKDIPAIAAQCRETGLAVAAICTREFTLNDPAQREAYLAGLRATVPAAKALGCRTLITQVGMDTGAPRDQQHASIAQGLRACVPLLEEAGLTLVIEPLNLRVDHPGYYLFGSDEGFDLVREVDDPHVRLLFDIYHQQVTEGDVTRRILAGLPLIGHFHAAGTPGRCEITRGELNYASVLRAIDAAGYSGYVGLEYMPTDDPRAGLAACAALVRGL